MIVGAAATIVALLALAWVQEIVGGFLSIFGVDPASDETRTTIIFLATVLMYCLDFAINTGKRVISEPPSVGAWMLMLQYSSGRHSSFHRR